MRPPTNRLSRRSLLALSGAFVGLGGVGPGMVAAARPWAGRPESGSAARQTSVRSGSLGPHVRTVPLTATLDHPQGITASADGATWYVSTVLRKEQKGVLAAFRASDGTLLQRVEVQEGACYHPGGVGRLGEALWLPVAEYRRSSSSVIQARDARTLALRSRFAVADHIGAVALTGTNVIGCNWDARLFYEWTPDGTETQKVEHLGAARYQDLQWTGEVLLAGGLLGDDGVIDTLEWPSLDLRERIVVGKTNRGVVLTHEGMAVAGREVLLMPEDDPTRVFVHAWAGALVVEPTPRDTSEPATSLFKRPRP